jgi:hypothetical protein
MLDGETLHILRRHFGLVENRPVEMYAWEEEKEFSQSGEA